ncbi:unnamed protein product [Polarella glacialis]|uniref:Uncharacterized protein n=2 Tax=Polarella glacialis TaxID=89957 RepID=A0A813HXT3_POLGL|nr:unnamed protein product [Polarella glacialis]
MVRRSPSMLRAAPLLLAAGAVLGSFSALPSAFLQGFSGSPTPSSQNSRALSPRGTQSSAGRPGASTSRRAFGEAAEAASAMVELFGRGMVGLGVLYTAMSMEEYVYHRYFQHLGMNKLDFSRAVRTQLNLSTYKGDGHVEHHRETLDDMTLDPRENENNNNALMLDADPLRGTAFPWVATLYMTTSTLLVAYLPLSFLGWSSAVIVGVVVAAVLLHALVWNALHPAMHGLPDVPITTGVPSAPLAGLRDSALFAHLRNYHAAHHRIEGSHGNYNVCCPMFDELVGTYVGEIPAKQPQVA